MPLKAYLPFAFSNTHENVMFDALVEKLTEQCAGQAETTYLIGNVSVEGEELDALFLKADNICVVELKHIGGVIRFSEMGPWSADGTEFQCVKGNPLRQVKGYIYTVLNYLKKHQNRFLNTTAPGAFPFIHGTVVFGKDFEMQNHGPSKLDNWFHVCDVAGAARKLVSLQDWNHRFEPDELEQLVRVFDVSDRFLYRRGLAGAVPAAAPKPEKRFRRFKIAYHKDSQFRDAQNRMREAGAAKSQGVVRLLTLMEQVRKGINAFSVIPCRADARIADSAIYTINDSCELAGIKSEETFYPFFIGDPEEVESWIAANEGLVLTVDGATKRIATTVVLPDQAEPALQPSSPTVENVPLLQRITGLDLTSLVPTAFIRKALERLDENSTDAEIQEVLESVPVEDVQKFLRDVINLLRAGDLQGAETRIQLRNGAVVPIVDAASVESDALTGDENSDQILLINDLDDRQMAQLLDPKHFQQWMLFLHQDQKRVAEADFDRPVVLKGVSGSGKTCILVHRARYLANKYPGERIAIMTLNRSLADLLRNLVRQLCTPEESARIEVMAFYDYFSRLLHSLGPDRYLEQLQSLAPENEMLKRAITRANRTKLANEIDTKSGETSEETWDEFFDQKNEAVRGVFQDVVQLLEARRIDACRYLREECTLVRSALTLGEREKYENGEEFKREGRTIAFLPSVRRDVLKILLQFEEWMLHGALLDVVELTQAVTPLWQEIRKLAPEQRFRCLLVDEFQDFSTLDLRLLVHVPTTLENGLFLAGDTVQKILVKRLNMTDAGLARGSATHRQIRKNYRNSRQILRAASKLANHYGTQANAQGEEIEILDPELATRATVPPIALKTDNPVRKAWEIAVDCLKQGSSTPWTVCIVTAAPDLISVKQILEQKPIGMRAELLTGDCINNPETLVVGTMQNLKGFEFTLVLLVGCEAGAIPSPGIPTEESWREALRLYVAMTRARDQVYLIYQDQPSEFLKIMSGEIIQKEECAAMNYEVEPRPIPAAPVTAPVRNTHITSPVSFEPDLEAEESCESEFNKAESELLHAYFAQHVFGKPNAPCESFRDWMKPKHLRTINFGLLAMSARRNRDAFQSLRHKFIRLRLS